jgi:hypothetical protein
MLSRIQCIQRSRFRRLVYIFCTPFVLSFLFFDVLDLDGSNFLRPSPIEKAATAKEKVSGLERADSLERASVLNNDVIPPFRDFFAKFTRQPRNRASVTSSLISARLHGYRVALPRRWVPD